MQKGIGLVPMPTNVVEEEEGDQDPGLETKGLAL